MLSLSFWKDFREIGLNYTCAILKAFLSPFLLLFYPRRTTRNLLECAHLKIWVTTWRWTIFLKLLFEEMCSSLAGWKHSYHDGKQVWHSWKARVAMVTVKTFRQLRCLESWLASVSITLYNAGQTAGAVRALTVVMDMDSCVDPALIYISLYPYILVSKPLAWIKNI